ncbi:F0F1 ATP synthase subunit delta [Patescibacteria group bacterium]|nr:F0F1 ATP synthase subunit delta [Patescibacteria group bacterium]
MRKTQKLAKILISLSENKSQQEKEEIVKNFLEVLKQKKKIPLLSKILKEVKREIKKKEVQLTVARKLDEDAFAQIKAKIIKVFGKEKETKIKIDENIIGGFLVKSRDYLIDASIKGMLNKLRYYGEHF